MYEHLEIELIDLNAKLPTKGSKHAAGFDVYSPLGFAIQPGEVRFVDIGIRSRIPHGYFCQMRSRSGLAKKGIHVLGGTIDSDYRGNWGVILVNHGTDTVEIARWDRLAQFVVLPVPDFHIEEVSNINPEETSRGTGGYGSTGR